MIRRNNITVDYVRSNAAYDIYKITGIDTIEEDGKPIYHEEVRGNGVGEKDVLDHYTI